MHRTNLAHINPSLGRLLVTDIGAQDIGAYQKARLAEPDNHPHGSEQETASGQRVAEPSATVN